MEHILDVRTKDEYDSGAVKGATNMPVEEILAGALPMVPKEDRIYVYCRSGGRSERARQVLSEAGYTDVVNLGGLDDARAFAEGK